jgi:hypothetical protein
MGIISYSSVKIATVVLFFNFRKTFAITCYSLTHIQNIVEYVIIIITLWDFSTSSKKYLLNLLLSRLYAFDFITTVWCLSFHTK